MDIVRMRDRFDPTFSDRMKYLRYWPDEGEKDSLKLQVRRLVRPFKALRMAGRAPDVLHNPSLRHPCIFSEVRGVFVSDSRYINYSDQPLMVRRSLILELLEWADSHKRGRRTLNGLAVPEIIINGAYWKRKKVRIAITDGVFSHARFDDSFRPDNKAFNRTISAITKKV